MKLINSIKDGVLSEFTGSVSIQAILMSLIVAFLVSLFIIFIYRKTYSGVVYSRTFALTIVILAMVTALIIRTISSNLALSLGMVGALSIVRFRTAVKEPIDTGFMFWGITAGIMSGAGLYIVTITASFMLGILYFVIYSMGFKADSKYLFILKYDISIDNEISKLIKSLPKTRLKSKTIQQNNCEQTFEIDLKDGNTKLLDKFKNTKGIISASIISYQNDFGG